jgi:hypothetical protein
LEQKEPMPTLKIPRTRKFFFQKLLQFSLGNNVLDDYPSNTDGFPSRDTCISSTQLNRIIKTKESLSLLKKHKLQEVLISKTNSIITGQECARFCSF